MIARKATLIVLAWNRWDLTKRCLDSLSGTDLSGAEVLVVDNGSTEDSSEETLRHGARWIRLDRNVSLARALNHGVQAASGSVVLLLNNDMRFHRDMVANMVAELASDPNVFAVDARQLDWDGTRAVHEATFLALARPAGGVAADEIIPGIYLVQRTVSESCEVVMGSGANLMIRKPMFESVGGLDERMQSGFEDIDLCWRARLAGWRTVFAPSAICWHKVGASSATVEGRRTRLRGTLAGRLLFAGKLLPPRFVAAVWTATLAGTLRDLLIPSAREKFIRERLGVIAATLGNVPDMRAERRLLFRTAGTSPAALLEELLGLGLQSGDVPDPLSNQS